MFLGEYQLKFTGQGRVILPKKLREAIIGREIILSRGFEGCIWGFDKKTWEEEAGKQLEISALEKEARNLRRYLFSSSIQVDLDEQGRFVIPGSLLTYAKIRGEVILVGCGDHFEIWDNVSWEEESKRLEDDYGRVSH